MSAGADDSPAISNAPVERSAAAGQRKPWGRPAVATPPSDELKHSPFVEVCELAPGATRGSLKYRADVIGLLHSEAPLPAPGDIIVLPRSPKKEPDETRLNGCDVLTPFEVVWRQHLYVRDSNERPSSSGVQPSRYLTTWIFVRRSGEEE